MVIKLEIMSLPLPQPVSYQMFTHFKIKLVEDFKGTLKGGKGIGLVGFVFEVNRRAQVPNKQLT